VVLEEGEKRTDCSSHDESHRVGCGAAHGGLETWSADEERKGVANTYSNFEQQDGAEEKPFAGVEGVQTAIDELEGTESK
jgi:hypothetical protein